VHQQADPLARGDPEGIAALRAHAPGPLDLRAIDDLFARVALDPQAFRDDDLLGRAFRVFRLSTKPRHSQPRRGASPPFRRSSHAASRRAPPCLPPDLVAPAKPALERRMVMSVSSAALSGPQ